MPHSPLGILGTDYDPRVLRIGSLAGVLYPLWYVFTPHGALDPWGVWWAIAAAWLCVVVLPPVSPFLRRNLQPCFYACGALVSVHMLLLAHLNDMHPFYGLGSMLSVMTLGIIIRSKRAFRAYATLILSLVVFLFLLEPGRQRGAYMVPTALMLPFFWMQLKARHAAVELVRRQQEELEQRVDERTQELSEKNVELRHQILERTALAEQLRFSQKMEAVGRLAGGVAHDFNNLLTAIRGYGDLVSASLAEGDPAREDVEQIQVAAERAADLTRQLLTFSRQSVTETRVLDLNAVVGEMLPMLEALTGESAELVARLSEEVLPVKVNRSQLEQVVLNLTVNGRDAMPAHGCFTLEISRLRGDELEPGELRAALGDGAYALLTATDTGVGIDAANRSRIFEPFYTTKDVDQGTGMGLAIVYGVIHQAGGHVRVLSEPGQGARFELYFPLAEGRPTEVVEDAPSAPSSRGNERVLLVEDEAAVRRLARRVLEGHGYVVSDAGDAATALEICDREPGPFDIVVLDVVMPQMSGLELAERLEKRWPGLPVLFVSGHRGHPSLHARPFPEGTNLLPKPFSSRQLVERVRATLDAARS